MRRGFAAIAAPLILVVVPSSVAAQSGAPGASVEPGIVVFTGSGQGGTRTEPFSLEPGELRLSYEMRTPVEEPDCGMGIALAATDGSYLAGIGNNGADVTADAPYRNETWFHVPTAGSYALDVGGDCDWDATLASMPTPDHADPIVVAGSGPGMSPSFLLGAGDHVIHYRATNPSPAEACIFFGPGLVQQGPYSQSMGDPIDTVIDPAATIEGEVLVLGVPEGRYALFINHAWCSPGLTEPIAWVVTIDDP